MENLNNLNEIWKDIVGYEGYYQVSNLGRIKSIKRIVPCGNIFVTVPEKILKSAKNKEGYLRVVLCKNGENKNRCIHRLVAESFIPNPNNLPQVNHKDECKTNNIVDNLEWCTADYNNSYGTRYIRSKISNINNPKQSKSVAQIDKKTGEIIKIWPSVAECGRNGFNQGNIGSCCRGKYKSACGYYWKYIDDYEKEKQAS